MKKVSKYFLYILKCSDKSLYTGITTDLKRRVREHNGKSTKGKNLGARYTSSRRPVKLVYSKYFKNRSLASKAEVRVKELSKVQKLALIKAR